MATERQRQQGAPLADAKKGVALDKKRLGHKGSYPGVKNHRNNQLLLSPVKHHEDGVVLRLLHIGKVDMLVKADDTTRAVHRHADGTGNVHASKTSPHGCLNRRIVCSGRFQWHGKVKRFLKLHRLVGELQGVLRPDPCFCLTGRPADGTQALASGIPFGSQKAVVPGASKSKLRPLPR